jgi:hypothetical protein
MTYEEFKAAQARLEGQCKVLSAKLQIHQRTPIGLTPDSVKATAGYKADKAAYDQAFAGLRKLNRQFLNRFKAEIRAERDK